MNIADRIKRWREETCDQETESYVEIIVDAEVELRRLHGLLSAVEGMIRDSGAWTEYEQETGLPGPETPPAPNGTQHTGPMSEHGKG